MRSCILYQNARSACRNVDLRERCGTQKRNRTRCAKISTMVQRDWSVSQRRRQWPRLRRRGGIVVRGAAALSKPRQALQAKCVGPSKRDGPFTFHGGFALRGRPWNIWGGQQLDLGRAAAEHMRGDTNSSPFVSLSEEASQLLLSPDDENEYGAKAIAENASELHTYTVPKVTTWTAEEIVRILEDGTENDEANLAWVSDTPTEEREVLFLGGNLDDYRTASESNPYRKPETRG